MRQTSFCARTILASRAAHSIAAAMLLIALGNTAAAAVIHSNEITDANPSTANPFTTGQTVSANMTASGIGRGSGISGNSGGNRYNAAGFSLGSIDLNDYFSWTLTPNSGFSLDLTSLTGNWQRSSTGANSYALRSSLDGFGANITSGTITGSGSPAAFNLDLSGAAFNAIASAVEFRLYGFAAGSATGTFSVNDFSFDGAVNALAAGNNSVITAPVSAAFGRVMQSQTPSINFNLTKTGSDATTYSATPVNNGVAVTADGAVAGGAQAELIGLQLQNNANGSAATGVKAYNVTIDNTAANSAAAGQGSADPNDVVGVSATVVANRAITSSPVNLGNVIVGASTAPQLSTLSTTGDDNNFTRVTVNGTSANDGSVTVGAASSQLFDGAADTIGRNVSGTFATAGAKSGSVSLAVAGEGLAGEAVGSVAVGYTANAYDASSAAFASNSGTTLSLDFGTFIHNNGVQTLGDAIVNLLQTAGFTAELDFDSIVGSGDTGLLFTDLASGEFTALEAGAANAHEFLASFDTNNAPGTYSATYTIGLSDADGYAGAGAAGSQTLTLNLSGTIQVPEPSAALLFVLGGLGAAIAARRGRSA
jgi:hypothetical protein